LVAFLRHTELSLFLHPSVCIQHRCFSWRESDDRAAFRATIGWINLWYHQRLRTGENEKQLVRNRCCFIGNGGGNYYKCVCVFLTTRCGWLEISRSQFTGSFSIQHHHSLREFLHNTGRYIHGYRSLHCFAYNICF